ncbi:glycosyltransferase family 2 protein [Psychrobacter sp. DAB_AL32B]|uniref:glycosyltransferase family 2 protein n=1 Tax=Psychrobacter sp. DAB_AL32B TaxID=1028414 RepID=UPI000B7E19D6|nr:glycosyltransferase family 2 protein [Psychrobacter sp. DAB_AL32B]OXL26628.1 glycosyltransferase [Psychrobacter sp. DAB_AL32B]
MSHHLSQSRPYLSIIIPAYNDADALQAFLPEVFAFTKTLRAPVIDTSSTEQNSETTIANCEIIIVDDGSRDHSVDVATDLMTTRPLNTELDIIRLSRNFGKEPALSAGLAVARGDVIAMIDADGQHPLSVLAQMLTMMEQSDIDMVAGIQANRPHESRLAKTLKGSFYHFIQDSQRYEIRPNAGDFRVMNRKVLDALRALPERQRFMKGLYAWVGFNTVYLPFTADNRDTGESKFNYGSLFELALVGITSFSQRPLRLISRMGFVVSALAFLYGLYIVIETLIFGSDVAGWATVAAGIMFSTGIQLVCIGVIGEYVGRLYEEVKQRPLYLIDETISSQQSNTDIHPITERAMDKLTDE